jgi:hypothetical protein
MKIIIWSALYYHIIILVAFAHRVVVAIHDNFFYHNCPHTNEA